MRVRPFALPLLLAVALGGCTKKPTPGRPPGRPPGQPAQTDPALEGAWQVVGIEAGGRPVPEERVRGLDLRYTFAGDTLTITRPSRPARSGPFTVDKSASLRRITLRHQAPPVHGLYEVAGDTLRLCLMVDEARAGEFPPALRSQASPKTDLLTLKKVR